MTTTRLEFTETKTKVVGTNLKLPIVESISKQYLCTSGDLLCSNLRILPKLRMGYQTTYVAIFEDQTALVTVLDT